MFKRLRNFLVTFTNHEIDLWVDAHKSPPLGGKWYWAQSAEEAMDVLSCYCVAKCRLSSSPESLEVVEFLENNPLLWPLMKPEVDNKDDIIASWLIFSITASGAYGEGAY